MSKVIFACGGTGGHIYPALALADKLKEMGLEIQFIGTADHIEAELVPAHGYPISFITISGFHRGLRLSNLLFPFKLILSLIQSKRLLKQFQPDLVIGTGGYVCGPVLRQAAKLQIATAVHESNSYPGVTTRLLQDKVNQIYIAYERAADFLKSAKEIIVSGNPIRKITKMSKADARKDLKIADQFTLLIVGGSQGARSVNQAVEKILPDLDQSIQYNLIWQTGKLGYPDYKKHAGENRIVLAYFDDMYRIYSAADLIVCRAGAMSLAEVAAYHLPALIIPLKTAAADHQFYNARSFEINGAAVLLRDNVELDERLKFEIKRLYAETEELKEMTIKMKEMARPEATDKIVESVMKLIKRN
ncbi:MAG: undecaprenyldiphospho-muramoylpentapeptide beta-N-acetylglucosaminyltransferase [Calditrichaeota bacterium]|nr:undecaprenyldiphospho-muramoylpentapeptide beta-N-acetylglucosaminyltransferase [Calditrichota bacterium]